MKIVLFPVLWILSLIYGLAVKIKYSVSVRKKQYLPKKTICVGNITTGGTGKTPIVIKLAKYLVSKGKKVAVLSRGYKRKTSKKSEPVVVSDKEKILVPVEVAGDEQYLIAKVLPGIPVIVCADRYSAGKLAVEKFGSEILLMDDGFQHWKLFRDLDIVLIDCLNPFGGGSILPLGFLREPLECLKRAGIILLTNSKLVSNDSLDVIVEKIKKYNKLAPVIKAMHKPVGLEKIGSKERVNFSYLKGKEIIALSSIGNPQSFELTLKSLGLNVAQVNRFPDHYWYTENDIKSLLEINKPIITTGKDAVRLEKVIADCGLRIADFYVLKIELEIFERQEFEREINRIIGL